MSKIWRMLKYARKESKKSTHRHRIGVVLTQGANILSRGYNQIRSAQIGLSYTNYPESLHAERHAAMQVQRETIQGGDLFIWRETKKGLPANSRPCNDCTRLLVHLGIKRIIHSDSEFPYYKIERL
jgi:deoxycytidylate deaminase